MIRKILYAAFLVGMLNPAWGKATAELPSLRQPSKIFIAGPGTVVSIHLLDLPFSERNWVVKYKIDGGELIEVWHPGKNIPVLVGMHGMLTYSTHPEMILNFRVVQQNLTK